MPIKINAWKCEFCRRYRITKGSITKHEKICFSNPDREILEGQMAIFATMPRDLLTVNSYGVPDSEWDEPDWFPCDSLSKKYKWWPRNKDNEYEEGSLGLGYIYENDKWVKMEGYEPPNFAPGFSWKNEIIPDEYNRPY